MFRRNILYVKSKSFFNINSSLLLKWALKEVMSYFLFPELFIYAIQVDAGASRLKTLFK